MGCTTSKEPKKVKLVNQLFSSHLFIVSHKEAGANHGQPQTHDTLVHPGKGGN